MKFSINATELNVVGVHLKGVRVRIENRRIGDSISEQVPGRQTDTATATVTVKINGSVYRFSEIQPDTIRCDWIRLNSIISVSVCSYLNLSVTRVYSRGNRFFSFSFRTINKK